MLQDIIRSKTGLFADGVQTVLRGHENRTRRVVLLKGNLVQNARSEGRGINARVNNNGTFGFASIAEYTPEAAEKVLKAATENALFLGKVFPINKENRNLTFCANAHCQLRQIEPLVYDDIQPSSVFGSWLKFMYLENATLPFDTFVLNEAGHFIPFIEKY